MDLARRILARDANFTALRRGLRAAVVMPAAFAISTFIFRDLALAGFAAFGSIATVLMVEFGGSMRDRLQSQVVLILTQLVLIALGTLAAQELWLAVPATLVVGFVVLFVGVVSSVLATATTPLMLAFIFPVTLPGTLDSLPPRVLGWAFAGALSLIGITVLWPAPAREPVRDLTARACALLARRLRAQVEYTAGGRSEALREIWDQAATEAHAAVGRLRTSFFSAPYRPAGLGTANRAVLRLVDQIMWLGTVLERTPGEAGRHPGEPLVRAVKVAAADLLERCGSVLQTPDVGPDELQPALSRLQEASAQMTRVVTAALPLEGVVTGAGTDGEVTEFVTSLEPSFRALEMSFAVSAMAANVQIFAAAGRRSWLEQMLGRQPQGSVSAFRSARDRVGSHLRLDSVWLRNSLRGAIAVALAVLVAHLVGAQHSFWVVLGTLSVLRSSALSTGQNAVRAVIGTAVGFVVGGLLILLIGAHFVVYWALLPLVMLVSGLAPAVISFTAGQASFTVVLLVVQNILAPVGWRVGLVRIEDVAIGVAVSVGVGFLFWPRGAASALGDALSDALAASAHHLRGAAEFGVTRCDRSDVGAPLPEAERTQAAAAARRLDDAFREFLAERGRKMVPLADVTTLLTAVAALRVTADAVVDLWQHGAEPGVGDRTAARDQIRGEADEVTAWYEAAARAVSGKGRVPDPMLHDRAADTRLVDTVRHDLTGANGDGTSTAVKMIWTADHLDAVRDLEVGMADASRAVAARMRARRPRSRRLFAVPRASA